MESRHVLRTIINTNTAIDCAGHESNHSKSDGQEASAATASDGKRMQHSVCVAETRSVLTRLAWH